MPEVWVLGGTGRTARGIAAALQKRGLDPVLVGRDEARLGIAAAGLGGCRTLLAADLGVVAERIRADRPSIVVNTIGPFGETAPPLLAACLHGATHYVDLANDVGSVLALLEMDREAAKAGLTFVTGAGWGVTGTESLVHHVCEGRPAPDDVRVDMIPSLALEAGPLGDALAGTIVEGLPGVAGGARFGGRRYAGGQLRPARVAGDVRTLRLPDGSSMRTASMPLGELVAAQRASHAPNVISASSEVPTAPLLRAVIPLALPLFHVAPLRRAARRRLAAIQLEAKPRPRPNSWARAEVSWASGETTVAWLRAGDASEFTNDAAAETAARILAEDGPSGCFTPAARFGTALAVACGAEFLDDGTGSAS